MKISFAFVLIFLSISLFAQKNGDTLAMRFQKADSLQIISHENLTIIDTSLGAINRLIVINNIPNEKIIKERITLSETSKKNLIDLFQYHKNINGQKDIKCFEPHHSVLIFKNGKCSYIDICFQCENYSISKDLTVTRNFLNTAEDWKKLEDFFRNKNIHYEMPRKE